MSWSFHSGRDSLSAFVHKRDKEFWEDVEICITCGFVFFWVVCQESRAGR